MSIGAIVAGVQSALNLGGAGASLYGAFKGGGSGGYATDAEASQVNYDNIVATKQSVLASLNNDASAPEWLDFLGKATTNQLDKTQQYGREAISAYKERVAKETMANSIKPLDNGQQSIISQASNATGNILNSLSDSINTSLQSAVSNLKPQNNNMIFIVAGFIFLFIILKGRK